MNQQQFHAEVMAEPEQDEDEQITLCPYCMNEAGDKFMCCGESSAHFVQMSRKAYENGEELP